MNDLTKISTSFLDMDEIAQYLWLKGIDFTNKIYPEDFDRDEAPGFILRGEKIADTKKVGGEDSSRIAVAFEDENGTVGDRTTVRNSILFNNRPASSYVSNLEMLKLAESTQNINVTCQKEIKDLRDELYQLRAELSKTGTVQAYKPYAGFFDIFRFRYPLHLHQPVAYAKEDSLTRNYVKVTDAEYETFQKGDYLYLVNDDGESCIVRIEELNVDHETLPFSSSSTFDILTGCKIYKSHGNIINETFTFGEINARVVDVNNKMVTTVNDDTNLILKPFPTSPVSGSKHVGFAFTFRIPETMQGNYLMKLSIMGKQYGGPGDMICYIIDERDLDNWKNPAQAMDDGLIIAQSKPVKAESAINITKPAHAIDFVFYDETTGEYPFIPIGDTSSHKIRYAGIIDIAYSNTQADLNSSETYSIYFVKGTTNEDLETNNKVFQYKELVSNSYSTESAFTDVDFVADLYYSLTLAKANTNDFVPYSKGIYTAKFDTSYPITTTMARLTLRVAREGLFAILPEDITTAGSDTPSVHAIAVPYSTSTGTYADDIDCFKFSKGKSVVVGLNPRKVTDVDSSLIVLDSPVRLKLGDYVYPMNYEVYLTARKTEWNMKTQKKDITVTKKLPMELKYIQPDQFVDSERISDRLIFECDLSELTDESSSFNDFELQIFWETSAKNQNERNAGRIHDLVLSLARTPNASEISNTVNLIEVTRPSAAITEFDYDGSVKNLKIINGYSSNFTRSGIVSATDAGEYKVKFRLVDGCAWADDRSIDDAIITWRINKAVNNLVVDPDEIHFD